MTRPARRWRATGPRLVAVVLLAVVATGCSEDLVEEPGRAAPAPPPASTSTSGAELVPELEPEVVPGQQLEPAPGTVPPPWLGTRPLPLAADGFGVRRATPPSLRERRFTLPDTLPALPGQGFVARIDAVPASVAARSTWRPGCPVALEDLSWVRLTFRGFDGRRHTGEMLVASSVAADVVAVFRQLWREDVPLEEMRVVRADELDAPAYGDGNNTTAFVCRASVGSPSEFSAHAYGLAIDVNPFQNPYLRGDLVIPERAGAYVDRTRDAPGMLTDGGPAVTAFAGIGWAWGGDWRLSKDWQHFSATGR